MRAVVIDKPGDAGLGERSVPTLVDGAVLIRVRTVGFCGSDLNTFRGLNPLVSYPRVPGHEIAGVVEAVGVDVPVPLAVGDDVTVVPYTACGRCSACRRGRINTCRNNQTLGVQRDGALTEHIVVPWQAVLRAEGLGRRELALVEPLAVGFHAVARGRVTSGDVVAVIGTGAVGLGAVAGAARLGATVIAVDVDDRKLATARRAGATDVVNSQTASLHDRLQELTDGDGPDVVIEAVGLPETFVAAVSEVAVAGRVVYIGYAKAPVELRHDAVRAEGARHPRRAQRDGGGLPRRDGPPARAPLPRDRRRDARRPDGRSSERAAHVGRRARVSNPHPRRSGLNCGNEGMRK